MRLRLRIKSIIMRFKVLSSKLRLREAKMFELSFSRSLVFPVKILVKLEMLLVSWDTLLVDDFTLFHKVSDFSDQLGADWENFVHTGSFLNGKTIKFPALWFYFRCFSRCEVAASGALWAPPRIPPYISARGGLSVLTISPFWIGGKWTTCELMDRGLPAVGLT